MQDFVNLPGEIPDAWVDRCLERLGRDPSCGPSEGETGFAAAGTVVVTGGAGSLGFRIAQAAARSPAGTVVLADRCARRLERVRRLWGQRPSSAAERVRFLQVDVSVPGAMLPLLQDAVRPVWVVHAAALKDVVQVEHSVVEAFRVNVLGTDAVLDAAAESGAAKVLVVSTDKAADPAGVLGFSKWVAEVCVRRYAARGVPARALRLGNVLGSRGSVLPRWAAAALGDRPWPLTDPACRRYVLAPRQAVAWMTRALADEHGGPLLVPDLEPPVALIRLARAFARVLAATASGGPRWQVLGLRRGEKRAEVLTGRGEAPGPPSESGLRTVQPVAGASDTPVLEEVREAVTEGDAQRLRSLLERYLVPDPARRAGQGARRAPM